MNTISFAGIESFSAKQWVTLSEPNDKGVCAVTPSKERFRGRALSILSHFPLIRRVGYVQSYVEQKRQQGIADLQKITSFLRNTFGNIHESRIMQPTTLVQGGKELTARMIQALITGLEGKTGEGERVSASLNFPARAALETSASHGRDGAQAISCDENPYAAMEDIDADEFLQSEDHYCIYNAPIAQTVSTGRTSPAEVEHADEADCFVRMSEDGLLHYGREGAVYTMPPKRFAKLTAMCKDDTANYVNMVFLAESASSPSSVQGAPSENKKAFLQALDFWKTQEKFLIHSA